MKVQNYQFPNSSFLSVTKDTSIIIDLLLKDMSLQKLLFYTTKDALKLKPLTKEESLSLINNQIRIVPKIAVDSSVLTYIIITFDNFVPNLTNPEFRDNTISFHIICHYDQWQLNDLQLRPFCIAAEIDTLLKNQRLTGIGKADFLKANQVVYNSEFAGLTITYEVKHGEEDKKKAPTELLEKENINNFNEMFNKK